MTVWEICAVWGMVLLTGWLVYVAVARWKVLAAADARKRRALEHGIQVQERGGAGGFLEGEGPAPTDAAEAFAEQRARERQRRR